MKVETGSISRWLWVAALCGIAACSNEQPDRTDSAGQDFLTEHWRRPLEPQGAPPPEWSDRERSLAPSDCGACHPDQFADWSTTVHARAMSPGLLGQFVDFSAEDRASQYSCLSCHAPSAEQAAGVQEYIRGVQQGKVPAWSDRTAAPLFAHGLACINCHYRGYTVYGPERKPELEPIPDDIRSQLPHGGWEIRPQFEDSRFCAACHQFEAGD
ncbi:MAG TPA: multiheme c-type cytochrome, partial [candidate division Zixibacteria bacterium]|nr:multiheme c-type cytochrome [candidate division Zixibacteria bacterium]